MNPNQRTTAAAAAALMYISHPSARGTCATPNDVLVPYKAFAGKIVDAMGSLRCIPLGSHDDLVRICQHEIKHLKKAWLAGWLANLVRAYGHFSELLTNLRLHP